MKLQLGVLHRDGRPVAREDVAALLGPWAARPAETSGERIEGPVALAYRGDQITPEDAFDVQPLAQGPYRLTWDGRLDNREDIARRAGLSRSAEQLSQTADAALVLAAYAAVGPSILGELLGEFALALYDTRTRELCLARSMCGARPLYYADAKGTTGSNRGTNQGALLWASDMAHLVRVSGVELAVNEAFVLGCLVFQPPASETPLRDIRAVPPNHALWFDATGRVTRTMPLWDPSRLSPLVLRSDAEYEARCRELVTEAVRVRLRAKHPVFAELSGGYDSSTVVLVADAIRHGWNQSSEGLKTLSCVYETSRSCDEHAFIRAVEDRRGVRTLLVTERDQRISMGLTDPDGAPPRFTGIPNAIHCFPGRYPTFAAHMREHGARVLLTGLGGDHLFWSQPDAAPVVADALWAKEFRTAHREGRRWSRVTGVPYHRLVFGRALSNVLALRYPNAWSYLRPRAPGWLGHRYRDRVASLVRVANAVNDWTTRRGGAGAAAPPSQYARLFMFEMLFRMSGGGHFSEYDTLYVSHPYTHRPLVEFCLRVPVTQHLRDGQGRSLMRRALGDLLPERTATRVSKGELDETLLRAVNREWDPSSDAKRWQVCQRGFVEPQALARGLQQMRLGFIPGREQLQGGALGGVFALERWLRSLANVQHTQAVTTARPAVATAPPVRTEARPFRSDPPHAVTSRHTQ